jgi:hypothetical protein
MGSACLMTGKEEEKTARLKGTTPQLYANTV